MNPVEIKAILAQIDATGTIFKGKAAKLLKTMDEYVKTGRYASTKQSIWLLDLRDQSLGGGCKRRKEVF